MRSMKLVVLSAMSLVALVGCNSGQPRIYRVAVDETLIRTISNPSCFVNNNLPTGQGNRTEQNYRSEKEWVIWQGTTNAAGEQVEYLDLGNQSWTLGQSPAINITDIIEGSNKTFSALRAVQSPVLDQYTYARQTNIAVTWEDYSYSPKGTIALQSQFACINNRANCPAPATEPDAASCSVTVNFVARRIEAQHMTVYGNNP